MASDVILATAPVRVAASASAAQVLARGYSHRRGLVLFNDSVGYLYVKYGADATATDFTFRLGPGEMREITSVYTGAVTGLWSAAAAGEGCAVTELV